MAVRHGRTIVPSEPDPEIDVELDLDIAAELSLVPRDRLNVRSVRSPATVLRTLSAQRPANQRFFFGPFRTLTSPKSGMRVRSSHYFAPIRVSGDGGNRTHALVQSPPHVRLSVHSSELRLPRLLLCHGLSDRLAHGRADASVSS
jgi:hypothetical protein